MGGRLIYPKTWFHAIGDFITFGADVNVFSEFAVRALQRLFLAVGFKIVFLTFMQLL
jgi:hypothetical protein